MLPPCAQTAHVASHVTSHVAAHVASHVTAHVASARSLTLRWAIRPQPRISLFAREFHVVNAYYKMPNPRLSAKGTYARQLSVPYREIEVFSVVCLFRKQK